MTLPLAQQTHFRAKREHAKQNTTSKRRENIGRKVDATAPSNRWVCEAYVPRLACVPQKFLTLPPASDYQ